MANKFVWSGATGGDTGADWQNAYSTLMKDWGAEAGFTPGTDFVYVRSTHNESNAASVTLTGVTAEGTTDPARILCVTGNDTGTDPGTLTTGAKVNTNATYNISIDEKLYIYGIEFLSGKDIYLCTSATDHDVVLEQCLLEATDATAGRDIILGRTSSTTGVAIKIIDTDIDFNHISSELLLYYGNVIWDGGSLLYDVTTVIDLDVCYGNFLTLRNCDLSICDGNLIGGASFCDGSPKIYVERCKIHASATLVLGTIDIPGVEISFHHCQSGTDSDPAYQMKRYTYQGTVETDTARYRDSGASDGERTNPYSWSMDTAAGSNVIELYEPLESPPIAGWTDGDGSTSHTYRIYVASGATLQDDEVWVELIGPNDAATDSLGVRKTTRPDPMATPANLTTDSSSTWNGADVTTKQQIDISYTPDKPGPITARVYCAKPSERVSVDPKVYVDPS